MGKNNTLQYFGLVSDKVPSTNEIWTFTSGQLTGNGWDSEKANNLQELEKNFLEGVKATKRAVIAVPEHGTRTKDFGDLLVEKQTAVALRIRIFEPDLKKVTKNFVLTGITMGPILPLGGDPAARSAYKLCNLKVKDAIWEAP